MRKILLAGAAMLATTGMAMAAGTVGVTINSSVPKACSVAESTTTITLAPGAGSNQPGSFKTTCNFSAADFTVNFKSANKGVRNAVENVTKKYTLGYNGSNYDSETDLGTSTGTTVTAAPGGTPGVEVTRNFSVAFPSALDVGGDYTDTLTITVAP
jgi:hypothetical protein